MHDVKRALTIDAEPQRVYPLISTAEGFTQW